MAAAWHVTTSGQGTITITFPAVIAAGPDYATDVLRDPWDMSNAADVSPEPTDVAGWSSFSVSGGVAGGTTAINDAGVGFLYRGINGAINIGRYGNQFPIDTSRYQKLSVSLSDSGTVGQNPQVYWFPLPAGDPAALSPEYGVKFLPNTRQGYSILVTDLPGTPAGGQAWTSVPTMRGFRIDPNSSAVGNQMFFDWIRLTCADNTPCATMNSIGWSGGSGSAKVEVLDAGGTVLTIATGVAATSFNWNSGILPPGNYTLRVTRGSAVGTKAFRINTPPTIAVTDPSRTTGEDYATTVLANAWDMSTSSDIVGSFNINPLTFSGGQLHGTNTNGDPGLELLNNTNNAGGARAIDTSRYRYFTYRIDHGVSDLAHGSVARVFWSSTAFAGGGEVTTTRDLILFGGMRDYTVDLASLSVGVLGGIENSGTMEPWTTNNKRQLRFDPHEFAAVRPFHIDDVKLTARPESFGTFTIRWTGGDADAGDTPTVALYYDTDQNPNNGKTLLVQGLPMAQGSWVWNTASLPLGTYYIYGETLDALNVSGAYGDAPVVRATAPCIFSLAPTSASAAYAGGAGTVGLTASAPTCNWTATSNASFITVTGGAAGAGNGTVSYNVARNPGRPARSGTITIGGQVFTINQAGAATPGDFDGNGVADYTSFGPGTGRWSSPAQSSHQWGLSGDVPVPGDYNGDQVLDRAVFRPNGGNWFIEGQTTVQWGRAGDIPVPADYNGDGATDPAIYRTTDGPGGVWYVRGQAPRAFGLNADVPIPADYDGDGLADLAVFRPSTGMWFIALSSSGFANVTTIQWGLPGDVPVPGDYDGDHKADLAAYRPSTGIWYLLYSAGGYSTSFTLSWGILGDVPVAADFSGDGIDDPTVFRASNATWWTYNPATQNGSSQQQGAPGDLPALQRPRRPVAPVISDFDGDARSDVTVFRPSNGTWFIRHSYTGYVTTQNIQWGLSTDVPVPGDYDGDHKTDTAVWRPQDGTWYLKFSIGGFTTTRQVQWGLSSDVPVPGDYDGDGKTDVAIYRPSAGDWYVRLSSTDYATFSVVHWGSAGDLPRPADYDGDGKTDVACFRPSTGEWRLNQSSAGSLIRQWGLSSDQTVPADMDHDGRADLVLFRPSTGQWLAVDATTGAVLLNRQWGLNGDTPVPHDFDGDGAADTAVFRSSTAEWFIVRSSAPGGSSIYLKWGLNNSDQPLLRVDR
jgi:hypothetical protein